MRNDIYITPTGLYVVVISSTELWLVYLLRLYSKTSVQHTLILAGYVTEVNTKACSCQKWKLPSKINMNPNIWLSDYILFGPVIHIICVAIREHGLTLLGDQCFYTQTLCPGAILYIKLLHPAYIQDSGEMLNSPGCTLAVELYPPDYPCTGSRSIPSVTGPFTVQKHFMVCVTSDLAWELKTHVSSGANALGFSSAS